MTGGQRRSEVGKRRAEARRCPRCGRGGGLIDVAGPNGPRACKYSYRDLCTLTEAEARRERNELRARAGLGPAW